MKKGTIIVLEDDQQLRELFSLALEDHGYQVVTAGNSARLPEFVDAHHPVLIITDLVMPDHDGMEAIFSIYSGYAIPLIAMSAYPQYLEIAKEFCSRVLHKPIVIRDLLDAVDEVLNEP